MDAGLATTAFLNTGFSALSNSAASTATNAAAQDVAHFEQAMQTAPVEVNPVTNLSVAPAVESSGQVQTIGDAVLVGLQKMGREYQTSMEQMRVHLMEHNDGPMNIQNMMQLQMDLLNVSLRQDLTAKVADRMSQGIQTLFRNQ